MIPKSKQIIPVPHDDIVRLRKNEKVPNFYDVAIRHLDHLSGYDSLECHLVVYPYSRKICSNNLKFYPYEEYVKDILTHQKSAYVALQSNFSKIFGLCLGALITFIFFKFKPDILFSVESIVSILGAYFVGKELWDELERFLIELTKTWRIRYQEDYYSYQLEKHTTLTHYSYFAKQHRYGTTSLLPDKIDFIEKSNSQTVRMYFDMDDLAALQSPSNHILSIHLAPPDLVPEFEDEGFLFGVKLSFNKRFMGVVKSLELFQSLHKHEHGCLDEQGKWIEGAVFYRKTFSYGRLKLFFKSGLLHHQSIVKQKR